MVSKRKKTVENFQRNLSKLTASASSLAPMTNWTVWGWSMTVRDATTRILVVEMISCLCAVQLDGTSSSNHWKIK